VNDATINDDRTVTMNYTTTVANAYPISSVSYLLAPPKMDATKGDNLKAFLNYGLSDDGQARATPLGYSPLPARLRSLGAEEIAKINPVAAAPQETTTTTVASGRVGTPATNATTTTTAKATVAAASAAATPTAAVSASSAAAPAATTPGPLAKTGGEQWLVALAGLLLIVLGGVTRRRMRQS
jgi:LPXTG-motif cell wall-anchored protein